jgi:hypothetical protein
VVWVGDEVTIDLSCDLVEDEDLSPDWFTTLADAPREGPVRAEIRGLVARRMRGGMHGLA